MSNNIYNILNTLNALEAKYTAKPVETPKAKTQLQESIDQVLSEKYMGFKKTVAAIKKGGSAENPEAVAAAIGRKKYGKEKFQKAAAKGKKLGENNSLQSMADKDIERSLPSGDGTGGYVDDTDLQSMADKDIERNLPPGDGTGGYVKDTDMDESALQAYLGKKKYGEQGMKALQKAGRDGASKEKMAKIRAKHDKMDEVAPPGAKAERMVKHIKAGYAKDGKLTDVEKRKAFGAAWKAHNKGKLEETIKAMYEAGFSKEQIIEGWDDMIKAVNSRSRDMKPGEKRQGVHGEIEKTATGVKHTRRYDAKTGETGDAGSAQPEKRKRGRPRKHKFESVAKINKMISESFTQFFEGSIQGGVWTSNPPKKGQPFVPVPQDIDGGSVNSAPKPKATQSPQKPQPTPPMGTIKGGVWTADPPKKGEVGVPVPVPVDEADVEEGNYFSGQLAKARAAGLKKADLDGDGDMEPVRESQQKCNECGMYENKCKCDKVDESLNLFRKLAGLQETKKSDEEMNEDDMEEGNEFSGALDAARDAGKKEFKVGGKTYPVKESQLEECGDMGPMANGMDSEQEGKMNVSTNMDSDGHKSVTVTADGNAAVELMQLLSLAGMKQADHSDHTHMSAEPEIAVMSMEDKDSRYEANTTPDEEVLPLEVQLKGGDGEVAGKEKKMKKHGYKFSDNPLAMHENMSLKLIKEYEGIKVKK